MYYRCPTTPAKKGVMGESVNGRGTTFIVIVVGGIIIALNAYLLLSL